jgi:putative peptidoglycan lipid II flippase
MDSQNRSLEFAMGLTAPAAVALAVMPTAIISVLFERGAFTPADTPATAYALGIFALGLPAFVMIKVFSPAYFAREDTATPMRYAVISLTANTLGSIALFFLFRAAGIMPHLGIAVATTLGGWLNAALLYSTLVARGNFVPDTRLKRSLPLVVSASVIMGIVLWVMSQALEPQLGPSASFAARIFALGALVATGLVVYAALVLLTGALRVRQFGRFLRRGQAPDA